MEQIKKYALVLVALIIGVFAGKYVFKPKPEIKTKEVVKIVEVFKEKKTEDKKVKTTITEKTDKDGNTIKETVITEDTKTDTITNRDSKLDSNKQTVVKSGHKLTLGVLGIMDTERISNRPEYGVTVGVPLFGTISLQGLATTDKKIGLGVAISF
jgi:hypothetical protein